MTRARAESELQAEADAALARLVADLEANAAALALAVLLRRSATRLHGLARERAAATRGEPDWASWAALQNAARGALLQASTCRDLAAKLARNDSVPDDATSR
jgi:hypothetical protein